MQVSLLLIAALFGWSAAVAQTAPDGQAEPLTPTPDNANQTVTRNKNWFVVCRDIAQGEVAFRACEMQQTLEEKSSGEPFVRLTINYPRDHKGNFGSKPVFRIFVPLNVLIQPGIGLQIDSGRTIKLPYAACLSRPTYCIVGGTMEDDIIAAMKSGAGGKLFVTFVGERRIEVPFSLSGFTASFNSLK